MRSSSHVILNGVYSVVRLRNSLYFMMPCSVPGGNSESGRGCWSKHRKCFRVLARFHLGNAPGKRFASSRAICSRRSKAAFAMAVSVEKVIFLRLPEDDFGLGDFPRAGAMHEIRGFSEKSPANLVLSG